MRLIRAFALLPATLALLLAPLPGVEAAAPPPGAVAGKIIVVDPGHGGRDSGAIANGVTEKDVNLAMGMALKPILESRGARVVMTRTTDVRLGPDEDSDLQARVQL